jgi:hypothetical protein
LVCARIDVYVALDGTVRGAPVMEGEPADLYPSVEGTPDAYTGVSGTPDAITLLEGAGSLKPAVTGTVAAKEC